MTRRSTDLIQRNSGKMPPKLSDPGSFCVPIKVGDGTYKALCDLGASVSIIPLVLCRKVGLGEPKPVKMTLCMTDRTTTRPVGIIEDVPIQLEKFFIPIDFVVLDIPADCPVPIILGRPFLATSGCLVDCRGATLTFRIDEKVVEFKLPPLIKGPLFEEDMYNILEDDEDDWEIINSILCSDPLEQVLTMSIMTVEPKDELFEEVRSLSLLPITEESRFEELTEEDGISAEIQEISAEIWQQKVSVSEDQGISAETEKSRPRFTLSRPRFN